MPRFILPVWCVYPRACFAAEEAEPAFLAVLGGAVEFGYGCPVGSVGYAAGPVCSVGGVAEGDCFGVDEGSLGVVVELGEVGDEGGALG